MRVAGLLRACHPEPTVVVTGVISGFAVAAGRGPQGVFWVASAILAGQLSVGWSNDFVDRDRDRAAVRRDKPIVTGEVSARLVGVAAAVALAAAVPLSFASGWRAALAHLVGVAVAWAYNLGIKATPFSPLPYAVAFGLLPAFVLLGLPGHPWPPLWLTVAGALLGLGAHFANVVPDIEDDVRAGVVGLPHRLGSRGAALAAAGLLLAATTLLSFGPGRLDLIGGFGIAAATLATGGLVASRRPFRWALTIAVLDVALLIARGASVG